MLMVGPRRATPREMKDLPLRERRMGSQSLSANRIEDPTPEALGKDF